MHIRIHIHTHIYIHRFWFFKTFLNLTLSLMALKKAADAVRVAKENRSKTGDSSAFSDELKAKKAAMAKAQVCVRM
jgi:hypothetical protein